MRKLPLLRQGQAFDYKVINQIISAINESIIDQPKYQSMMNDLAAVTNNYTTSIESFISRYKDVVENTPTLHELLVAYASLQEKTNGSTQATMVNVPYVNLDFVYNPNEGTGVFELVGNLPDIGTVPVGSGQCVIAGVKDGDKFKDTKIFVNCADTTNPNFLCLDVIRGPQGPAGQQGSTGPRGASGADGKDGQLITIKGKIELESKEQLVTMLDSLVPNATGGDGWVYENVEGGPVIYVYVGDGAIGVETNVHEKFITIKTMRGPAGPAGPASVVDICFSQTEDSEKVKYNEIDDKSIEDYYFMWIRVLTEEDEINEIGIPYSKIRIRQRELSIEPYVSFNYEVKKADGTVENKQTDAEAAVFDRQNSVSSDTTDYQRYIFGFKDPKEVSGAAFDEEGHLVFSRKYVNAGVDADPIETDQIVHTPILYFDGSTYNGEETSDAGIVRDMADAAGLKYRSFVFYKTQSGQDLQIWEITFVNDNTQVTKRSSLFMNIISDEGVWSTKQGDNYTKLLTREGWDARSIPVFSGDTISAQPKYGEAEDGSANDTQLCFNGKTLLAGDNYLVVKTFNFDDENGDSIYEAYISSGSRWINILKTKSAHGDKPYLVVRDNILYLAYIKRNQSPPESVEDLIMLFDFASFVSGAVGTGVSAPVTGDAVKNYVDNALESALEGISAEDIETLQTVVAEFKESGFDGHNKDSNAHQDIRTSLNNSVNDLSSEIAKKANKTHTHAISEVNDLQGTLDSKADKTHTHSSYATTESLKSYVTESELETELNGYASAQDLNNTTNARIAEHDERTDAHQDIRDYVSSLDNNKADKNHTHTVGNINGLQDELNDKAIKGHKHVLSDISDIGDVHKGLEDIYAAKSHTHSISNISELQNALSGKADQKHTHLMDDIIRVQDAFAAKSHTHTFSDITGSQDKLEEFATKTEVNGMFSYNSSTRTLTITSLTT